MEDREPTQPLTDEQLNFAGNFEVIAISLASLRTTIEGMRPPVDTATTEGLEAVRQWHVLRGHMQKVAVYWDARIAQNPAMKRMWDAYQAKLKADKEARTPEENLQQTFVDEMAAAVDQNAEPEASDERE